MNIQQLFKSLSPTEQQKFAKNNKEDIEHYLTKCGEDINLSGYSKEELIDALKDAELDDTLTGADATTSEIQAWLEEQLRY